MNVLALAKFTPPPLPEGEAPSATPVCYENIGPRERQIRARFGTQALVFGLALAAVLLLLDAHPLWRLLVFLPAATAATNWLQARERT